MRTSTLMAFGTVLVVASAAFSQAPVAMRVEVEPQGEADLGTRVEVVIQVSPEDRRRVGEHAMVRIELDGEVPRGQSPLWAVSFGDDGSAVIETTWPAGEHRLVVNLESPDRQQTGLWVGTVRVPSYARTSLGPSPPPLPSPTPTAGMPTPTPTPSVVSATPTPTLLAATATPTATPLAPPPTATLPPPAPVTPTAVPAVPPPFEEAAPVEAPREGPSQDSEPATEDAAKSTAATAAAAARQAEDEVAGVVASAGAAGTIEPEPLQPEADDIVQPPGSTQTGSPAATPEAVEAPPAPADSEPVVEPLRAERSADDAAAAAGAELAASPPVVDQTALAAWGQADPKTRDVTVRMSRQGAPVAGLSASQFDVELSGSLVPVAAVGDADTAPLLMGFAFDLSPQSAVDWQRISRGLDPLLERARDGRGRAFVATAGEVGGWNENPASLEDERDEVAGGDLAGLVINSLGRFDGQRGRSVLLVVTDGRSQPSKDEWRQVAASVEAAGVQVLVASLWDDRFSQKLRKQLSQVAVSSGGKSFLVQGADQFASVVDRFGPLVDATVALRLEAAFLTGDRALNLRVNVADSAVDVTAPKIIR